MMCCFSHFLSDRTVWLSALCAGGPELLDIFNFNLLGVRAIKRARKLELHLGHLRCGGLGSWSVSESKQENDALHSRPFGKAVGR